MENVEIYLAYMYTYLIKKDMINCNIISYPKNSYLCEKYILASDLSISKV